MEPQFVISQYADSDAGQMLGNIAGPFGTLDEARLEYGFDNNSFIVLADGLGAFKKVMRWSHQEQNWQSLELGTQRAVRPLLGKKPIGFDPEIFIERASEIAENFGLSETATFPSGTYSPKAVVIGDYPEPTDTEVLYNGQQGQILKAALLEARLGPQRVYLTTLTKHRLLDEKEKLDHDDLCKFVPVVLDEIMALNPTLVFLLGMPVAKAVLGDPKLNQNVATSQSFKMNALPNTTFRIAYHPKYVIHAGGIDTRTFDSYVKQFSPFLS